MEKQSLLRKVSLSMMLIMLSVFLKAQEVNLSGTVKDVRGETIIGASVLIEGTTNGTITDFDGKFVLSSVPSNATIVISYIGYSTEKIQVNGKTVLNVILKEDTETLEEVVVVGYGVQRKSDLTGSVASVKADNIIKSTPSGNISDALQGRMAGVSVLSGSGDPSGDNTIRVRGINSITAEGGPLIVIDGFIGGSLKSLNPSDIASIEVLKDASATAVYGSRGANGVILVTTKDPGIEKLTVSFNAFANFKTVSKYPDTLSPYEYALLANDYAKEYFQGSEPPYYSDEQLEKFKNGEAGYDYSRNIFRSPALAQNYELSVSGGNEKTSFLASLRYENNEGVIKASENSIYTWRLKVDTKILKWLKAGMNFYGYYNTSQKPRVTEYDGLIQQARYFPNTIEPKDENGNYNNFFLDGTASYNPMGMIWESSVNNRTVENKLQGYVEFNILDGLTFRSQFGVAFDNRLNRSVENDKSYNVFKNGKNQAVATSYYNVGWLNTNTLNYTKEFNANHRINATAVFEQSYNDDYSHKSVAEGLDFASQIGANGLQFSNASMARVESNNSISTLMSGMLRLNYVLLNRYMFTASIRADGSSRLVEKWSYFPSAAFAWNIKDESFLKSNQYIDQLKLRVGYGSVGNQAVEPYRPYSKLAPAVNPDGTTSYVLDRPAAPYLVWERNDQVNVGIDLGFFNNRLVINADWYNKLSKDILLEVEQPGHMGFTNILKNAGEIRNTGVEFTISTDPIVYDSFKWHSDVTLSHNKGIYNKIPTHNKRQQQAGKYQNLLFQMIEGEKLGSFWGYRCEGVWQEDEVNAPFVDVNGNTNGKTNGQVYKVVAGNSKFLDVNKDGQYNDDDMGIIGCGQPTFNWGWNNNFIYKDFDLSLFVVGFHGFDIYNATHQMGYRTISGQNMPVVSPMPELLDRWTPDNTDTDIPGFVKGGTESQIFSDRFVENGSFIKVKNITLGYTLPYEICRKAGIGNLRLYVSVQNPFQITKYSGLDPESTMGSPLIQGVDWGSYPNSRNYLMGLNFSF